MLILKDYNGIEYEVIKISSDFEDVKEYDSMIIEKPENGATNTLDVSSPDNILFFVAVKSLEDDDYGETYIFTSSVGNLILGE